MFFSLSNFKENVDADVIIVGGGPSGSTAAKELAESGYSVILLDKERFPRDKVCAGGLMAHTFKAFPYVKNAIDVYNKKVRVISPNLQTYFEVASDHAFMAMTEGRREFDHLLLTKASKAGAEIREGAEVVEANTESNFAAVMLEDGTVLKSKILIGADSVHSVVAKSLGLSPQGKLERFAVGVERDIKLSEKKCDELYGKERTVSLLLYFNSTPGYAWVFPRKNSVNIGIGGPMKYSKKIYENIGPFMEYLRKNGYLPETESEADGSSGNDDNGFAIGFNRGFKMGVMPMSPPTYRIYTRRALLIGDAGRFNSAATGEGIYYGMMSGRIAAGFSKYRIKTNSFNDLAMKRFYRISWRIIGEELNFHYNARIKVLNDERRCRKAANWGRQDEKLRRLFANFLTGNIPFKNLPATMAFQYIRCKIKEKLGGFKKPAADIEFERSLHK